MINFIEQLPLELVGGNVLNYLAIKDFVMLERACGSKKSHQLFLEMVLICTPFVFPSHKPVSQLYLTWCCNRHCKISNLVLYLLNYNNLEHLRVDYIDLHVLNNTTTEIINTLLINTVEIISI